MFDKIAVVLLVLSLSACATLRPRPAASPAPAPPSSRLQSLPPSGAYPVDSQNSELRVLVYRAGPLANFGHNHVLVNRGVSGVVQVGATLAESSFSLQVPTDKAANGANELRVLGVPAAGGSPVEVGRYRFMLQVSQ